jgi:hypothetical protein
MFCLLVFQAPVSYFWCGVLIAPESNSGIFVSDSVQVALKGTPQKDTPQTSSL